jgi:hypothetical protein
MLRRDDLETRISDLKYFLEESLTGLEILEFDVCEELEYLHKRNAELIARLYPVDKDDEAA